MRAKIFQILLLLFLAGVVLAIPARVSFRDGAVPVLRTPSGMAIFLQLAETEQERIQGLGGKASIAENSGLLFVFPERDFHGMWMKGMMFPLDLVWLNEREPQIDADERQTNRDQRKTLVVVDLKENVSPETYPTVFYPKERIRYVLELTAGTAKRAGMEIGALLTVEK